MHGLRRPAKKNKVDVVGSKFTGNFVSGIANWTYNFGGGEGGGLLVYGEGARVSLVSSTFDGNGGKAGGGAMIHGNNTVTVEGCRFEDNLANNQGGAFVVMVR